MGIIEEEKKALHALGYNSLTKRMLIVLEVLGSNPALSQIQWWWPGVPATWQAQFSGAFEAMSSRPAWVTE